MLPFKSITSSPDTWSTIKFHLSATLPSPAEQPLVSFVQLHPLHEMHVRIELIVARCPSSRLFSRFRSFLFANGDVYDTESIEQ